MNTIHTGRKRSSCVAATAALAACLSLTTAGTGVRQRYERYASTLADRRANPVAAAAAAAHEVPSCLFPDNQEAFDAALAESLAAVPDGRAEVAGVALGRAVLFRRGASVNRTRNPPRRARAQRARTVRVVARTRRPAASVTEPEMRTR